MAIKKAKARRGSTMKIKRSFTKRTSAPSIRVSRLNRAARPSRTRHTFRPGKRKSIRR